MAARPVDFPAVGGTAGSRRFLVAAAAILAVALAGRVAYVLLTPGYVPVHDDHAYDLLASAISRTGVYPLMAHRPTAYRPPGYPYFLAAVYAVTGTGPGRIQAARLVQAVIGTGIVALLGLLALRLFGRAAAACTMALAAVYPPLIGVGASLLSEPQTVLLDLVATLAVVTWRRHPRRRWVVLAGLTAGVLTLTRSNAFVIVPALALGLWTPRRGSLRRSLGPPLAVIALTVAVVAPWTVRNAVVMHSFIPVSDETGGTLAGTYNPVSAHDRQAPAYWHLLYQIPQYQAQVAPLEGGPEPVLQSRLLHLAVSYAENHPLYVGKVALYNTLRLLDAESLSGARYTATLAGITYPAMQDATIYGFWVVAVLAAAGATIGAVRRRVPGFVWLQAALLFLTVVLVNAETPRLRIPIDPFLLLLAGGAAAAVLKPSAARPLASQGGAPASGGGLLGGNVPVPAEAE